MSAGTGPTEKDSPHAPGRLIGYTGSLGVFAALLGGARGTAPPTSPENC